MSFNNGLYDAERRKATERSINLFVKEVMPRFTNCVTPADPLAIDLKSGEPAPLRTGERVAYD